MVNPRLTGCEADDLSGFNSGVGSAILGEAFLCGGSLHARRPVYQRSERAQLKLESGLSRSRLWVKCAKNQPVGGGSPDLSEHRAPRRERAQAFAFLLAQLNRKNLRRPIG
jgi:hypothetical protein